MADRYIENKELKSQSGRRYRINSIYPTIPASANDTYIITTGGDRYDTLALQFYKDTSLWWIIAAANNSKKDSLAVEPGIQLRIPANPSSVVSEYNRLNNIR
jgi:nucleoid-associated protein YgaU